MFLKLFIIVFHLLLFVALFRRRTQMVFYLPILLADVLNLVSLTLIEGGAYITEEAQFGYPNGSFFILYAFLFSTLVLFYLVCPIIKMELAPGSSNRLLFYLASGVFIALTLYALAHNPDAGRFNIFGDNPFIQRFGNYYFFFYAGLYAYCVFKEASLRIRTEYLCLALLAEVLKGSEFGGFFVVLVVFYTAHIVHDHGLKLSFREKATVTLIAVFLLLGAIAYKFSRTTDMLAFLNRLVLSGHLFWSTVNMARTGAPQFDFHQFLAHFFSISTYAQTTDYGLGRLMYAAAGPLADEFLRSNVRFSGGYPAILVFNFGYFWAFLLNAVCVLIFAATMKLQMYLLRRSNFVIFILFTKLSFVFVDFFTMGEFSNVNLKTALLICATIVLSLIWKREAERIRMTMALAAHREEQSVS